MPTCGRRAALETRMRTALDSSVILDVFSGGDAAAARAETALHRAGAEGQLILCESVLVEISPEIEDVPAFLSASRIQFVAGSIASAHLAGQMYAAYLARGGKRGRVVADFLIGAHAKVHADRLLARDGGYFRDYFRGLKIIEP